MDCTRTGFAEPADLTLAETQSRSRYPVNWVLCQRQRLTRKPGSLSRPSFWCIDVRWECSG
eukprot:SAG11_NODE_38944_length_245_cov_20.369863_1_plen_60_part_10